ncbi:MAG: hypothetical protein ACLFS7_11285, partial [Desulfosudaceae bacterium]
IVLDSGIRRNDEVGTFYENINFDGFVKKPGKSLPDTHGSAAGSRVSPGSTGEPPGIKTLPPGDLLLAVAAGIDSSDIRHCLLRVSR